MSSVQVIELCGGRAALCSIPVVLEVCAHQPLLGVMAGLLDEIAGIHVLGNHGSKHEPRGLIALCTIYDMEQLIKA